MKSTKKLMHEIGDKSVFVLAWAIWWRVAVVGIGVGFIIGLITG